MNKLHLLVLLAGVGLATGATAADWSDTSFGWRYGSQFAEPFNNEDISKNIFDFHHVSGWKYGSNFFNVDLLISDQKDPAGWSLPANQPQNSGAQEAYVVYRNTVSLSKAFGTPLKWGYIRDVSIQGGFDWNTKKDAGYNSRKQMLVIGPVLSVDVPGFLDVGVLEFYESNAPYSEIPFPSAALCAQAFGCSSASGVAPNANGRYHYTPHPALSLAWGVPISDLPLSFSGYALWIASKGKNEFGGDTVAETHIDMKLMLDVGKVTGGSLNGLQVGLEYEYWQNKFGNDASHPYDPTSFAGVFNAGKGAFAHTPMIRVDYHF